MYLPLLNTTPTTHTFPTIFSFPFAMYLPNHLPTMPYINTRKISINFVLNSGAYVTI